ncbi:MAG TPA: hypothetical protein VN043_05060 [Rhodanobacter sp.]|nr:hypothetical protein [Rhodanobacter sp.]
MPTLSRFWSPFRKARESSTKIPLSRTQRSGRNLMSLASLFGFCAAIWWLMIALVVWRATGGLPNDAPLSQKLLKYWHWASTNKPIDASALGFAWLLTLVATLTPIVYLRRLGYALYTQPPLSFIVARRFLWLGRALVAHIVLGFAAGLIAVSQIKEYDFPFSLGFWGTFVAAILAYVVADVIREGARAAEENREFV